MTKESLTNYARTREFFKAALQEDAHLKNPPTVQEKDWIRQRNVSGSYYASDKSMLNIGRVYGITKEGVRRSVHKFVERLWKNSSENTRERFPLGLLPIAKPRRSKVRPTNLEIANVPKKEPNFYQRIANAQDRVELQILLDNVTATFYRTHSRGDNPLFLSLTRVAKKRLPLPQERRHLVS